MKKIVNIEEVRMTENEVRDAVDACPFHGQREYLDYTINYYLNDYTRGELDFYTGRFVNRDANIEKFKKQIAKALGVEVRNIIWRTYVSEGETGEYYWRGRMCIRDGQLYREWKARRQAKKNAKAAAKAVNQ